MSHQGIVTLRPSRLDVAISKRCARAATPDYASDVAAGLIIGAGLGKAVRKFTE
jgi:hypothetical protein